MYRAQMQKVEREDAQGKYELFVVQIVEIHGDGCVFKVDEFVEEFVDQALDQYLDFMDRVQVMNMAEQAGAVK